MELSKLSLTELNRLFKRVESEIERRAHSAKKEVLRKVQKIAAEAGITIEELIGGKQPKISAPKSKPGRKPGGAKKPAVRKTVGAAKYCNPANTAQTWTGRGRKPQWVQDWLADNKALADLEIKG